MNCFVIVTLRKTLLGWLGYVQGVDKGRLKEGHIKERKREGTDRIYLAQERAEWSAYSGPGKDGKFLDQCMGLSIANSVVWNEWEGVWHGLIRVLYPYLHGYDERKPRQLIKVCSIRPSFESYVSRTVRKMNQLICVSSWQQRWINVLKM
jgi:hypothetical protein